LEEVKLESLKIDGKSGLEVLKTESPVIRAGGVKVETVDELISKLKNEAKII